MSADPIGIKIGRLLLEMPQGTPHEPEALARRIAEALGDRLVKDLEHGQEPRDTDSARVEMNMPQQATLEKLAAEIADKIRRSLL